MTIRTGKSASQNPSKIAARADMLTDFGIRHAQARLIKTLVSNSTFDRGSLSPTYVKPFDVLRREVKLEIGSSGWTRTSNPPVNSRMLSH